MCKQIAHSAIFLRYSTFVLTKFFSIIDRKSGRMSGNSGATTAATSGAVRQGGNVGHFIRRLFELFWLLLATFTALFFFKTAQETNEENLKLRDELRRAKQDSGNDCSVCLSNPCEVALQPCGHVCLCRDCVDQLGSTSQGHQKCPICRTVIEKMTNVYLS